MTKSSAFLEYLKLHEISLIQDAEKIQKLMDSFEGDYDSDEYRDLETDDVINTGELIATRHILSVATDIMNSSNERYE
jgi:hypothetical protein